MKTHRTIHLCLRLLVVATLVASSPAQAAGGESNPPVEIVWSGTYGVSETAEIEDPSSPMGRRFVSGGIQPLLETTRIPARIGTRFGFGFVLHANPAELYALWRFPPRGLMNPETRTTTYEWKMPLRNCPPGRKPYCLVGYPLRHDWELVPGRWTIEIWGDGARLAERSFELY